MEGLTWEESKKSDHKLNRKGKSKMGMTQSQLNLETNDEDIYGRWKLMKKIRAIAVVMAMTVFLSGCYDYGRDITIICPVINYMAVDGGAIVIYEMDGERREKKFLEKDVYACDESSRIIAVGKVYEDGSKSLRLYLYLSEEDYAQYTKYRFDLD